jgi:hypothetical protein
MASKEPTPISLSRRVKAVEPLNMDASEHVEPEATPLIVQRVVKDKALESRVARLEAAGEKEIIVNIEAPAPRPRITSVAIQYDSMGHPKVLVPTYSE